MRNLALPLLGLLLAGGGAFAQEPAEAVAEEEGWSGSAELSLVALSGNSESSTFGFRTKAERKWLESLFEVEAAAVRAEQTTKTFRVTGPPGDETVVEEKETLVNAENYLLRGQYSHDFHRRLFGFGGAGWDRNEPAGIRNRYYAAAGVGHNWAESDEYKNRTSYGLSYIHEENTSGREEDFPAVRLTWDFLRKLTATTTFSNALIVDDNLDDTSDYRGDLLSSLAVAMNERLALKVSLQLVYDHEPAFVAAGPLEVQLENLDTTLSASLVMNF